MTEWESAVQREIEGSAVGPCLILVAAVRDVTWARFQHPDLDDVIRVEVFASVDSTVESVAASLIDQAIAALGLRT